MASEMNTDVKFFRGVKNKLRIPDKHGIASNENTSVSWSAGSGTDGTSDPQHVNIKLYEPSRAGPPVTSPRRDAREERKSGPKWLIIAFGMTTVVSAALSLTVFVLLMKSSGGGAGIQNVGNFSKQAWSTSNKNFEEWKTIMNATFKQNDIEILKLQNELNKKSKVINDMEAKIDARFEGLERKVNAELEKGNAEIEKVRNESIRHSERIEEHREDLEATIDEKFGGLETQSFSF